MGEAEHAVAHSEPIWELYTHTHTHPTYHGAYRRGDKPLVVTVERLVVCINQNTVKSTMVSWVCVCVCV